MGIIGNKWIEKEGKRKDLLKATAPAYKSDPIPDFIPINPHKPVKRHTKAMRANLVKTLRGVRK
jgi:hypothetical protein